MFPTHFASIAALYAALTGRTAVPVRSPPPPPSPLYPRPLPRPNPHLHTLALIPWPSYPRPYPRQVRAVELMARHADLEATSAADGYNPLLEDFKNTSILMTDWGDQEAA